MSKLLDHLKKHKGKYLSGLTAAALAAGTGAAVHHHIKKKDLEDAKLLRSSRLMSHARGLGAAVIPHIINTGNTIAFAKGSGQSFNKEIVKDLGSRLWHGTTAYRDSTNNQLYSKPSNVGPDNQADVLHQVIPGLKHSLKSQAKTEVAKAAINKLSDILVNKMHGDKWNSHKNALKKMVISNHINGMFDVASTLKNIGSQLNASYKQGQAIKNQ